MHSFVRYSITKCLVEVDDNSVHKSVWLVTHAAHDASTAHTDKREALVCKCLFILALCVSVYTYTCISLQLTKTVLDV